MVSVVGTTGERASLSDRYAEVIAGPVAHDVPVALGFGISHARAGPRRPPTPAPTASSSATRLVRAAAESDDPPATVGSLVAELAAALRA